MPTAMTAIDLDIEFRTLVETDVPLLHAWIQRPHVAEWWDGCGAHVEDTERKCLSRLGDSSTVKRHFAILPRT